MSESQPEDRGRSSGLKIGPYLLQDRLGEGGMGEVYRARRVEDFSQTVAIKLLVHGLENDEMLARFRAEQQVLASLNHQNIVRLLDAGVSADGVPYIAMEHVDGIPLDRFCEDGKLDRDSRLRLMIQVLDAVEYAHRRFLVHCDLKYSNILVTPDGTAKLLDFGITKLLQPAQYGFGESLTRTFRPMTLEFASPEQLQSQKLSTSSDIYACGVLLYGLLTGQHPFEDVVTQPLALVEAIRSNDPELPSRRVRRIAGAPVPRRIVDDLDAINAKALQKEPGIRYRSAERFAEDLRRYLQSLPVEARDRSLSYRARKFVRRHRVAAIGVIALAIAIALGVAGTISQSIRAQRQRARAEARFNETRKLADSLLFGFYDSVSKLPGATHAQQLIVNRSLSYLDNLARDGKDDANLQLDLAEGYVKLASVQGSPYVNNAGLPTEALATADKAIGIAASHANSLPHDYRAYLTLARAHEGKGDVLLWLGRIPESIQESTKAIEILDKLLAANAQDVSTLMEASAAHETLGDKLGETGFASNGEPRLALLHYRRALELMEAAHQLAPAEMRPRRGVIVDRMKIGSVIAESDPEDGLALLNQASRVFDALTPQEREESPSRRLRTSLLRRRGETELELGRYDEADRDFAEVQRFLDSIFAIDPRDARAKWDLIVIIHARGDLEQQRGRLPQARDYYQRLVEYLQDFPGLEQSSQARASLDEALIGLGEILTPQGNLSGRKSTQRGLADFRVLANAKDVPAEILYRAGIAFIDAQPPDLRDPRFALLCLNRALAAAKNPAAFAAKARTLIVLADKPGAREAAFSGLLLLPPQKAETPAHGLRQRLLQLAAER